jgi:hypothetical protein
MWSPSCLSWIVQEEAKYNLVRRLAPRQSFGDPNIDLGVRVRT